MQITANLRAEILLSLPKLSLKDADQIADNLGVSRDTVYRHYRKLKGTDPVEETDVILSLTKLAASRKPDVIKKHKRMRVLERQLSGIR
jgi:predicted ArsR family transcriptional regulator